MNDQDALDFYANPANREPQGPPRIRITGSVRVTPLDADGVPSGPSFMLPDARQARRAAARLRVIAALIDEGMTPEHAEELFDDEIRPLIDRSVAALTAGRRMREFADCGDACRAAKEHVPSDLWCLSNPLNSARVVFWTCTRDDEHRKVTWERFPDGTMQPKCSECGQLGERR